MTLDDWLPLLSEVSSIKRGIEMSWSFNSLRGSRGPFLKIQHRKADLCPQKLPAEEEEKRSQSPGSSAGGWFPAMLIFQNSRTQDSLEGEQQHYIISRRGPELSVQFPWFPLALCSSSFAATDLAHPVSRLYMCRWLFLRDLAKRVVPGSAFSALSRSRFCVSSHAEWVTQRIKCSLA